MHRIDTPTREKDLFGPGKDGFTGGDPLAAKPPTDLSADWFNDVQENIAGVIEGAGIELVKGDSGQLLEAILGIVQADAVQLREAIRGRMNTSLLGMLTPHAPDSGYVGSFRGVTYGAGLFVAVGQDGEIQTSPDGMTWTRQYSSGSSLANVYYADGLFVASGGQNGSPRILTSPDGATWTPRTPANESGGAILGCAHGNGLYVLVAAGTFGGGTIQTSPDGITWTSRTPEGGDAASSYQAVVYADGLFVAVGQDGEIQTSPDGITWTRRQTGLGVTLRRVVYADGLFVAVGQDGEIQTSPDGMTWTRHIAPMGGDLFGLAHAGGLFIAGASNGEIWAAPGSLSWAPSFPAGDGIISISAQHPEYGHVVLVGENGSIYTTPALI